MIYGYIRVSTEKQTVENQRLVIRSYCKRAFGRGRIEWVAETISGTARVEKRTLGRLLKEVSAGDVIVVTELSRLGRSLRMILEILEDLLLRDVKVIAIKEGFELGDNIQSKVIAFAFGLCAEVERQLLSERTKQGVMRARREGKLIGREKGERPMERKLFGKVERIKRMRRCGYSKTFIAKKLCVSRMTLHTFMKCEKIL